MAKNCTDTEHSANKMTNTASGNQTSMRTSAKAQNKAQNKAEYRAQDSWEQESEDCRDCTRD